MDLPQQVKNFEMTVRQAQHKQVVQGLTNKDSQSYQASLQAYGNGEDVPYSATLKVVQHEGSRAARLQSANKTQKPPGYIRNESGGYFTS